MLKCLYCGKAFNEDIINPKTKELYQTCELHRKTTLQEKIEREIKRELTMTEREKIERYRKRRDEFDEAMEREFEEHFNEQMRRG